jgi:hypothetical protein
LNLEELKQIAEAEQEEAAPLEHTLRVCVAASCLSSRSDQVMSALESEVKAHGLEHKGKVKGVGCMGLCAAGSLVEVYSGKATMYQAVVPEDLRLWEPGQRASRTTGAADTQRSSPDRKRWCWRTRASSIRSVKTTSRPVATKRW